MRKGMTGSVLALAASLALAGCTAGAATGEADTLADEAAIEKLLVGYYANFGGTENENFAAYYTEDAVFDVNGRVATGRDAIVAIYEGLDSPDQAAAPVQAGVFHMMITNLQISVEGDTATTRNFWTGVMNDDPFAPPSIREQGREYNLLVKQDGQWLIKKRVVIADSGMPDSFRATYEPRMDYDITKAD